MLDRIAESRARYEDLSVQLADPNIHADPKRMRELSREHSRLAQVVEAAARLDRARVELAGAQEMLADGADDVEMAAMAREEAERPHGRRGAAGGRAQAAADPPRPAGRPRRRGRGARRHRRRRGGALRGRPVPHVQPLCRPAGVEGGGRQRLGRDGGRVQGGGVRGARRQRLRRPALRERRAPRAARAGHGDAGAHPHLRRHRRRAAGGGGGGRADQPQRAQDRRLPKLRPGRAVGEHDRLAPCASPTFPRGWW